MQANFMPTELYFVKSGSLLLAGLFTFHFIQHHILEVLLHRYVICDFLQVILYSLMLSDRYFCSPPGGLLVYLRGNHMQGLSVFPHEKRGVHTVI